MPRAERRRHWELHAPQYKSMHIPIDSVHTQPGAPFFLSHISQLPFDRSVLVDHRFCPQYNLDIRRAQAPKLRLHRIAKSVLRIATHTGSAADITKFLLNLFERLYTLVSLVLGLQLP
jgi:hypothetical protein